VLPNSVQIAFQKADGSNRNFMFQLYDGATDSFQVPSSGRAIDAAQDPVTVSRQRASLNRDHPLTSVSWLD